MNRQRENINHWDQVARAESHQDRLFSKGFETTRYKKPSRASRQPLDDVPPTTASVRQPGKVSVKPVKA